MASNMFPSEAELGGIVHGFENKILICFLLEQVSEPLTLDQIYDILGQTNSMNFFELATVLHELEESEHLHRFPNENGEDFFEITEIGKAIAKSFGKSIPVTIREKALDCTRQVIQQKKQLDDIEIKYKAAPDGYILSVKMRDIGSDLMNLNFFVPTREECIEIRERIYSDPELLYRGILAILLGNYQEGSVLFAEKADEQHEK